MEVAGAVYVVAGVLDVAGTVAVMVLTDAMVENVVGRPDVLTATEVKDAEGTLAEDVTGAPPFS